MKKVKTGHALAAQRRPGTPEPMTRVFGGVGTQPGPQISVRISRSGRQRQLPVGRTSKPNRFARQPLRHAQRPLEHVHGAALGGRAQNFPFATSRSGSFNRGVGSWGEVLGDNTVAAAMLDRLLHRSVVLNLDGDSYRLRDHNARAEKLRRTTTETRRPLQ